MGTQTAKELGLRRDGTKLLIPFKDENGNTTGVKWRDTAVSEGPNRWGPKESQGLSLYENENKEGPIYVVESPSEGLILAAKGKRVVFFDGADSLIDRETGKVNEKLHSRLQKILKGERSILIPDNDSRGQVFAEVVERITTERKNPPAPHKDLRDFLTKGKGDIEKLSLKFDLEQFINNCHNKSDGRFCEGGPAFQGPDDQREYTPLSEEEEEKGYSSTAPIQYPPNYKEESEAWIASLTPEEQKAAADYTGSYLFDRFNQEATGNANGVYAEDVAHLDSALAKAPVRDKPIRVYRRARIDDLKSFLSSTKLGDVIPLAQEGAFQSTSVTNRFPVATGQFGVIFEINTRSGAAIGNVTQGGGTARELEILLPRAARYRVVSIQRDVQFGNQKYKGYGDDLKRTVIQVEEVG